MKLAESYRMRYAGGFLLAVASAAAAFGLFALHEAAKPCQEFCLNAIGYAVGVPALAGAALTGLVGALALLGRWRAATVATLLLLGAPLCVVGFQGLRDPAPAYGAILLLLVPGAGAVSAAISLWTEGAAAPRSR